MQKKPKRLEIHGRIKENNGNFFEGAVVSTSPCIP